MALEVGYFVYVLLLFTFFSSVFSLCFLLCLIFILTGVGFHGDVVTVLLITALEILTILFYFLSGRSQAGAVARVFLYFCPT